MTIIKKQYYVLLMKDYHINENKNTIMNIFLNMFIHVLDDVTSYKALRRIFNYIFKYH
jgi:hypothetical protein